MACLEHGDVGGEGCGINGIFRRYRGGNKHKVNPSTNRIGDSVVEVAAVVRFLPSVDGGVARRGGADRRRIPAH